MSLKINWQAEQAISLERIADSLEILVLNQKPNSRQVKDLQKGLINRNSFLMAKFETIEVVEE